MLALKSQILAAKWYNDEKTHKNRVNKKRVNRQTRLLFHSNTISVGVVGADYDQESAQKN